MKLRLPRGLYLTATARASGQVQFRWGHAPKLRERGIRPISFYADGPALSVSDLAAHGLRMQDVPRDAIGRPLLYRGPNDPLDLKDSIAAARALKAALDAMDAAETGAAPEPATSARQPRRRQPNAPHLRFP